MRLFLPLILLVCVSPVASSQAKSDGTLSLDDRVFVASQVYSLLQSNSKAPDFENLYKDYLQRVLASDDRRQFDLATMEFVAKHQSGHTFFLDAWLDNLPLDFCAIPLEEKWVVTASVHESLKPGEVMTDVNEATVEAFFLRHRRYISASSAAAQRRNLFLYPYLFPQHFTLTLEDGREVAIDRAASRRIAARTEGRWVETNRVAVIKIPTFLDPTSESTALDYVRRFHRAQILIVDLKNNSGGIPPQRLIRAMMNQPFRGWSEVCLTYQNCPETPQKPRSGGSAKPDPSAFRGRVILLVDGGCVSACEDFVEPFKETGRGTLVGETTQGSSGVPFVYDFHNGMTLRIAVKRNYFSDGTEFEGIGIKPDIEVHATIEDLKKGRDPVLQKALELAEYPLR